MRTWLTLAVVLAAVPACVSYAAGAAEAPNPLLSEWKTPFGVPPFDEIKPEHYLPAFRVAIERHLAEVEAIAGAKQPPTFANTIEALENSGLALERVNLVFGNLGSAETSPELQAIDREVSPMLASHCGRRRAEREAVPAREEGVGVAREAQARARPGQAAREHLEGLRARRRAAHARAEDALPRHQHRAGQPGREVRRRRAQEHERVPAGRRRPGRPGRAVGAGGADRGGRRQAGRPRGQVAVHAAPHAGRPLVPRAGAEPRAAPASTCRAYLERCAHGDSLDNRALASRTAALRAERAQLLGYRTHADFVLDESMAKTPEKVRGLLDQLWTPAPRGGRPRGGGPAGGDRRRRQGLHARAVGLVLLHREGAQGALRPRRRGAAPVLRARARAPGRLRRGHEALRHHLHARHRTCRSTTPRSRPTR